MVDAGSFPLRWYLHIRFNPWIMKLEDSVVKMLSFIFFRGDKVTWIQRRCLSYRMWERGYTNQEIVDRLHVPLRTVRIWANIWDSYYVAFNTKDYNATL